MPEYAAQAAEAFTQVREQFEETLGWLAGAEAGALEHGRLEDQLGERGPGAAAADVPGAAGPAGAA